MIRLVVVFLIGKYFIAVPYGGPSWSRARMRFFLKNADFPHFLSSARRTSGLRHAYAPMPRSVNKLFATGEGWGALGDAVLWFGIRIGYR